MQIRFFYVIALFLISLLGCSSPQGQEENQAQDPAEAQGAVGDVVVIGHVPTIAEKVPEIEGLLREEFEDELEGLSVDDTRYAFSKLDLDEDGIAEMLVYLPGPHFCTEAGCTLLLIRQRGNSFEIASRVSPVQLPVMVSNQKTKGWKDLVVDVAPEGGIKDLRVLPFDGETYPVSALKSPARKLASVVEVEEHLSTAREGDVNFTK